MRTIRDLGLLDLEPVLVKGQSITPRDVFIACAEPRLKHARARDLVALRVEADGTCAGRSQRVIFDLLDYFDEDTGLSAMERTTGFSLSITGQLQAQHRVRGAGVMTPDLAVPPDVYIEELQARNIRIRRRDEHEISVRV
jgi:lysine 6-dehydrogenase